MEPTDGEEQPTTNGDIPQQPEPSNYRTELVLFRDALSQRAQPLLDARREAMLRGSGGTRWEQMLSETAETDLVEYVREAIARLGANLEEFGSRLPHPAGLSTWLFWVFSGGMVSLLESGRLAKPPSSRVLMAALRSVSNQLFAECAQRRDIRPYPSRVEELYNALWGVDLWAQGFESGVEVGINPHVPSSEAVGLKDFYKQRIASENGGYRSTQDVATERAYLLYLDTHRSYFLNKSRKQEQLILDLRSAEAGELRGFPLLALPDRTRTDNGVLSTKRGFGDTRLQQLFSRWEKANGVHRKRGRQSKAQDEEL
jgi:hypothetical protein